MLYYSLRWIRGKHCSLWVKFWLQVKVAPHLRTTAERVCGGLVLMERNLILNAQFVPKQRCQERIILINANFRCAEDMGKL